MELLKKLKSRTRQQDAEMWLAEYRLRRPTFLAKQRALRLKKVLLAYSGTY